MAIVSPVALKPLVQALQAALKPSVITLVFLPVGLEQGISHAAMTPPLAIHQSVRRQDLPSRVPPITNKISGTAMGDHALSADTRTWTDTDGDTLTYSHLWYQADDNIDTHQAPISSATSTGYAYSASEAHKDMPVVVAASDDQENPATSSATSIPNSAPTLTLTSAASGLANTGAEVVFIESNVTDYQTLVDGVKPGVEVVLLDASQDGLDQIAQWAQTHSGYDAIHIISHGGTGALKLGSVTLTGDTLANHSTDLAGIGQALSADGDILLYGCDVARGTQGLAFLGNLAALTSADIAASDNATGAADRGGDWTLEASVGTIDTRSAITDSAAESYHDLLAAPVISNLDGDSVAWAGVGNTVTLDAGGNTTVSDAENDSTNWNGSSLTVVRNSGAWDADVFGFTQTGFVVNGSNLETTGGSPTTFASFTNTNGTLTITFDANSSTALVSAVLAGITYRNDTPAGDAIVRFTLSDGTASTTADVTVTSDTIYVTNTTDTATIDVSDGVSFGEAIAIAATNTISSQTLVLASTLASGSISIFSNPNLGENLALDADSASGATLASDGVLTIGSGSTLTVTNGPGDLLTIDGELVGDGSLTKTGAGTLTLSGSNSYSGATTVSAGTLVAANSEALGSTAGGTTLSSGTTLQLQGGITLADAITINAAEALINASGDNTISGNIIVASALGNPDILAATGTTLTLSGVISGTTATNLFLGSSTQTGMIVLSGNNTFNNYISIRGGTVVAAHNNAFGGSNNGISSFTNGATLGLQGGVTITGESLALSGSGVGGNGALLNISGNNSWTGAINLISSATVGVSAETLSLSGVISGAGGLTKQGAGTLTLSGTNTYSGGTTVSAGIVSVTGTVLDVTVKSGSTLAGTGTTEAITVEDGTIAPGNTPGILNTGNLSLTSNSILDIEINGTTVGTQYDQTNVTGTVNLGGATLDVALGYSPTIGDTFTIINNDGADAITGSFTGWAEGAVKTINGSLFKISYTGGTGNDVTLTVVANAAPVASNVQITGTASVGQTLTGSYSYNDTESDSESGSTYRWVRSSDNDVSTTGDNTDTASGATGGAPGNNTYTVTPNDRNHYLFYCVTPKAGAGTSPGTEVCSTASAQVPNNAFTWNVTTPADPGVSSGCISAPTTDCSLRDAIANASTTVVDTIGFAAGLTGQTITLGSTLTLSKNLTIDGTGRKVTLSGNNTVPVFSVTAGTISLGNLTVTDGQATNGGGLSNAGGTVTIQNSAFTSNTTTGEGGGIYNASGTLTIVNSIFANNNTGTSGASLAVSNSSVTVLNSSFVGSAAGGEIAQTGGTLTLTNTLIDNATATCTGTLTDGGHNLDRGTGCGFTQTTSHSNTDPLLGSLGDYGGDTQTLPLLPGSPAIDAGDATTCADTNTVNNKDQRGITRPQGAVCDIGAFESQGFTFTPSGTPQSTVISTAFTSPLKVTVVPVGTGEPVDGGNVTFTTPSSGASATLGTSNPVTIASGSAQVNATANATAGGPYTVTASAAGASDASFSLTNSAPSSGGGGGDSNPGPTPVNGACGSAHGQSVTQAPSTNLCSVGTASAVTGTGPWSWSCTGSNGGSTASCTAPRTGATVTTALTGHSPNPALTGQPVIVTYTVTPTAGTETPTGNVTVSAATGETCTATVAAGTCTLTFATAGYKTLTATYAGDATFANSASPPQTQQVDFLAQGTTPGNAGTILVEGVVSGGAAVSFTTLDFLAAQGDPASPPDTPPGVRFPYGLLAFTATGLPPGGQITLTLTYPDPLPFGTQYWKYGPTANDPTAHWYVLPASVNGHQVTFTITDGGLGDSDLAANGTITDPGGPGVGAADIPTLSQWALLLLGLLLAALAWRKQQQTE